MNIYYPIIKSLYQKLTNQRNTWYNYHQLFVKVISDMVLFICCATSMRGGDHERERGRERERETGKRGEGERRERGSERKRLTYIYLHRKKQKHDRN
jgi:hypothetical protein